MTMMKNWTKAILISFLFGCEPQPEPFETRLQKVADEFCMLLALCTNSKFQTCIDTFQDVQIPDRENELFKLKEFTRNAKCSDYQHFVRYYKIGGK